MARKTINTMLRTPDGIFNTLNADIVTNTDSGVAIVHAQGNLICFIKMPDSELRRELSLEISDRVYNAQIGENVVPIDWEAYGLTVKGKPVQSDKAAATTNKTG